MNAIVVDLSTSDALGRLEQPTEIRNSGGSLLGVFTPSKEPDFFDLDDARRLYEEERHSAKTTAEVLQELEALGQQP